MIIILIIIRRKPEDRQVLRTRQRTKKPVVYDSESDTRSKWNFRNDPQRLGK